VPKTNSLRHQPEKGARLSKPVLTITPEAPLKIQKKTTPTPLPKAEQHKPAPNNLIYTIGTTFPVFPTNKQVTTNRLPNHKVNNQKSPHPQPVRTRPSYFSLRRDSNTQKRSVPSPSLQSKRARYHICIGQPSFTYTNQYTISPPTHVNTRDHQIFPFSGNTHLISKTTKTNSKKKTPQHEKTSNRQFVIIHKPN